MHYFASLNDHYVCTSIFEVDDTTYDFNVNHGTQYENEFCVEIPTNDQSLINKKKYVAGEWRDCFPSETGKIQDTELVHMPDDRWLSETIGDTNHLDTNNKDSLVAAINECVTKIANLEAKVNQA